MKIGILSIGQTDAYMIDRIQEALIALFPRTTCTLIAQTASIPEEAFNKRRQQYNSNILLSKIHSYADRKRSLNRILGIVDIDIFVPNLNFVFGEAEYHGKAALISLWRLRPEFYGKTLNKELFVERSMKKAMHEIGHTLGLTHCPDPFCVMFFSNSIFETDRKQSLFCNKCYMKIDKRIE
jgi:archaemetzincin